MSEPILIVDPDPASQGWLEGLLVQSGFTVETATTGSQVLQRVEHEPPALIVLDLELPDMDGCDLIRRLRANRRLYALRLIIFSARSNTEDFASGLGAGADDYILKRLGADVELLAKIRNALARPLGRIPLDPTAKALLEVPGRIISFFSPKGGTGTTTLCANFAYQLCLLERLPNVLAADMVLPLGTLAQSLNYQSELTTARLIQEMGEGLDQVSLAHRFRQPGPFGFRILPAANDIPEADSIDPKRVAPLFDLLQQMFDYVLVDTGRSLSRVTKPILQMSDLIVLVVTPDNNTIKLAKSLMGYLRQLDIPDSRLYVLNNRTVARTWISKENIEGTLNLPVMGTVPFDGEQVPLSINEGVPYLARFGQTTAGMLLKEQVQMVVKRLKGFEVAGPQASVLAR